MDIKNVTIQCQDGFQLGASEFVPVSSNGIGIIINGATGVLRKYYQAFSEYLCEQGFTVLSYDFRGIGESQVRTEESPPANMVHWGQRDMDDVMHYFKAQYPKLTIKGIGHSIGGQLLGLMPDNNRYDSFLNIASQHAYWKNWSIKNRTKSGLLFFILLPLFSKLFNGLPGWVLGSEPLNKHTAADWGRFGRKAHYRDHKGNVLKEGFESYQGSMRFYSIADDLNFAPEKGVKSLQGLFKNASSDHVSIHPKEYGMKRIEHFGFFQKKMNKKAWAECADWLAD